MSDICCAVCKDGDDDRLVLDQRISTFLSVSSFIVFCFSCKLFIANRLLILFSKFLLFPCRALFFGFSFMNLFLHTFIVRAFRQFLFFLSIFFHFLFTSSVVTFLILQLFFFFFFRLYFIFCLFIYSFFTSLLIFFLSSVFSFFFQLSFTLPFIIYILVIHAISFAAFYEIITNFNLLDFLSFNFFPDFDHYCFLSFQNIILFL